MICYATLTMVSYKSSAYCGSDPKGISTACRKLSAQDHQLDTWKRLIFEFYVDGYITTITDLWLNVLMNTWYRRHGSYSSRFALANYHFDIAGSHGMFIDLWVFAYENLLQRLFELFAHSQNREYWIFFNQKNIYWTFSLDSV